MKWFEVTCNYCSIPAMGEQRSIVKIVQAPNKEDAYAKISPKYGFNKSFSSKEISEAEAIEQPHLIFI